MLPDADVPKLPLPWLSVSPLAVELLLANSVDPLVLLNRHRSGDWGEADEHDWHLNEVGMREGNALLGVYRMTVGQPVVVLTEANHLFAHILALDESPRGRANPRVERELINSMKEAVGSAANFPLGTVVLTPGAIDVLARSGETPTPMLVRHVTGDWGDVSGDDKQANERALLDGERLLSSYMTKLGEKLWVLTEADRECTTLLLPDEY